MLKDVIVWIFTWFRDLRPPKKDDDPTPWRKRVFWSLLVLMVVLSFHLAATNGYLINLGISPVASAAEVQVIQNTNKSILYAIYSPQVRDKIRQRCEAEDSDEKERINKDLDRLLKEYEDAAGKPFDRIPACDAV